MSYNKYWDRDDVAPINKAQKAEVAGLKAAFVEWAEAQEFKRGEFLSLDPKNRVLWKGEGDYEGKIMYKWGPWEWNHVHEWVRKYLGMIGFSESYHFIVRPPIGVIEFRKEG